MGPDVAIRGSVWKLRGIWHCGLSFSQQYSKTMESLNRLMVKVFEEHPQNICGGPIGCKVLDILMVDF